MSDKVGIATIGFTETTAENFFQRLLAADVKKVLDVRLNNTSQLSAFAKATDLRFFLNAIGNMAYQHLPMLAPTSEILTAYKKHKGDWGIYETRFMQLMAERKIEEKLQPSLLEGACLLCSEATPHRCHRRLICEYLNGKWGGVLSVKHL